jgi:hypothetical protein
MSDFIRLPKRNIWRAMWDIRPTGIAEEPVNRMMPFVDLRLMARPIGRARLADLDLDDVPQDRALYPVLRRIGTVASVLAVAGALLWAGNSGRAYIESKKIELLAAGTAVAGRAEHAMDLMRQMRFRDAEREFRIAAAELNRFERMLGPALLAVSITAKALPANDYVKTAFMLRDAKSAISAVADFNGIAAEIIAKAPEALFRGDPDFPERLASGRVRLEAIGTAIAEIEKNRNALSDSLAGNWFSRFPEDKAALQEAVESFDLLGEVLGTGKPMTVLLLFQNPAEIRATGGFVGSYGVLRLEKGKIVEFKVDDIYNPDGQLDERVLPPRPLRRVTPAWGARDANWFFDFGLSAKKTAAFLEKTTGLSFDIVVAVNPPVIAELIDLVGPIEMPEYGKTITAENFWEEAQYQTRAGEDRKINQPKRFLTIFGPRLLEKMQNIDAGDVPLLADILSRGLSEKNLLLWAEDPELQAFIEERNWGGRVAEIASDEDYLAVVMTNIGGAKADYVMRQIYHLQTTIEPSGDIVNTLRITRTHEGDRAKYPWWNARNFTYIRVFVPQGSVLLSASGASREPPLIEPKEGERYALDPDVAMTVEAAVRLDDERVDVFEESRRTVFGFWHAIDPGQSKTITLRWQLPFKAGFAPPHYSLSFQTQSGVGGVFQHTIELPRRSVIQSVEPAAEMLERTSLGERFSWIGEEMKGDIRHAISYQLK